jgi:hypothetical protein
MKWQRAEIQTALCKIPTQAQVYGPFGMFGCKYGYTVVHLQTGLNVCTEIEKDKAKELILELIKLGGCELWNFGIFGDAQGNFSGGLLEATRRLVLEAKDSNAIVEPTKEATYICADNSAIKVKAREKKAKAALRPRVGPGALAAILADNDDD